MRKFMMAALAGTVALGAYAGDVTMEKKPYGGWDNCITLSNGAIELVATTDVGPRIIRLGYVGGQNLLKEFEEDMGQVGDDWWRPYGGHRLWHAPEAKPRTYVPDNDPVAFHWDGSTLRLVQPTEPDTGIGKVIEITLDAAANHVTVRHVLINHGPWAVELAPWALTMMAQGGRAIYPQAPYRAHTESLLPAGPLVLWAYTDMSDPRWTWGSRYIQLRQDPNAAKPTKAGFRNSLGWAAYVIEGEVFLKRFTPDPNGAYPDYGCNTETFTNADILEVETLGPLATLAPDGGEAAHIENWFLFKADIAEDEAAIDATLLPLVEQAAQAIAPPE